MMNKVFRPLLVTVFFSIGPVFFSNSCDTKTSESFMPVKVVVEVGVPIHELLNLLAGGFHAQNLFKNDFGWKDFGGYSIGRELFAFMCSLLPERGTLLELGSGWSSGEFSKFYTVYSIEHDAKWVGKYNTNYIHAPIKDGWYDVEILKQELPDSYDLIFVDGPPGSIGRYGFYEHLDLFKTDIPIIFHDVERQEDYDLMVAVATKLGRSFSIYPDNEKEYGIIFP